MGYEDANYRSDSGKLTEALLLELWHAKKRERNRCPFITPSLVKKDLRRAMHQRTISTLLL
jgi:hypothetical protein